MLAPPISIACHPLIHASQCRTVNGDNITTEHDAAWTLDPTNGYVSYRHAAQFWCVDSILGMEREMIHIEFQESACQDDHAFRSIHECVVELRSVTCHARKYRFKASRSHVHVYEAVLNLLKGFLESLWTRVLLATASRCFESLPLKVRNPCNAY